MAGRKLLWKKKSKFSAWEIPVGDRYRISNLEVLKTQLDEAMVLVLGTALL